MFFQVSWIRCHIVRTQGKKERRNPVKTGEKLLTLTIFELQLCSLHQKLRFEKPEWKLKCLWVPNQRGKVRDFRFGAISFEYREREGKNLREIQAKRGEIGKLEGLPANPSQILPTFCHGTKVKPWKIWRKNLQIYRSFDGREEERKEEKKLNKQTKEILISKENSLTNKQRKL